MTIKTKITPLGTSNKAYKKDFILFESGYPGTYTLEIKKGIFEISICGGGGGGSNGAGGAGAALIVQTTLENGIYNILIGTAGAGASAYVRNNNGYAGGLSSLSGKSVNIVANGGAGRNGRRNGGGGGTVGALSYSFMKAFNIILQSTTGADYALSYLFGNYEGNGAGGQPQGNDEGSGYAGKTGYIKIKFIK